MKKILESERAIRLIPPDPDADVWGISVSHCSFVNIQPGASYPPRTRASSGFTEVSWRNGQIADEYRIIYISAGRGVFESNETGRVTVEDGQVIMIFPGVWHRYRPVKSEGWEENRIGFKGPAAERILNKFFSPEKAVIPIGQNRDLKDLIQSIGGIVDNAPACCHQIAAARTMEIIALVRSRSLKVHHMDRHAVEKVRKAMAYLNLHCTEQVDVEQLAAHLGLSESRLRAIFKMETGIAPYQYLLNIRINLARHWLTESNLPITEIAEKLGFSSVFYFSRLFKKKTGCPPSEFRKH